MAILHKSKQMKKELDLFSVYAIATGATIASGFFLLPGIAFAKAGPAMVLSYLIAAVPLLPAVCSMAELSTAMPRAGGIYYFLDRSLGPLWGTIGGIGTWLALSFKAAFALIGIGAYLGIFFPDFPVIPVAVGFAVLFGLVNLFGAKKTGVFQMLLVVGLLGLLSLFIGSGLPKVNLSYFTGFFDKGFTAIFSTAGMVFISYIGLTKIASVAEEIKKPERNIPLGMFLALGTALLVYIVDSFIMVGVLPGESLTNVLTPVAAASRATMGAWGPIVVSVAAVLAFFSVANAGILSASRYPLGMSRDRLLPFLFQKFNKHSMPRNSIYMTVLLISLGLVLFNPEKIAKLASALELLLFALCCLAVIIMRESRIHSYDPGFRTPFYPWTQIVGILTTCWLIIGMGWLPILFLLGMIALGVVWYFQYGRQRVIRDGAIYHIFAHLGERRFEGLDRELRGILKEKGLREHDPFDVVIAMAHIVDMEEAVDFKEVVRKASDSLSQRLDVKSEVLFESFLQGTRVGATPVSHGVALPHMRLPDIQQPELTIVRSISGVTIDIDDEFLGEHATVSPVFAFFFLVSPEDNPGQHLRILAHIAEQVDTENFMSDWMSSTGEKEMKEIFLRQDRIISLEISLKEKTSSLVGKLISELKFPRGCVPVLIHRGGIDLVADSHQKLEEGDVLIIIGPPKGINQLNKMYLENSSGKPS